MMHAPVDSAEALRGETSASAAPRIDRLRSTYGDGPSEYGFLSVPQTDVTVPVIVVIHGGFWRSSYGFDLMEPMVDALITEGWAVWNIEYGRVGEATGGWPGTFDHVGAAVDHLSTLAPDHPIDLNRVGVIGHSAGGHLAAWVASRHQLRSNEPGADPRVQPVVAIGQGAVIDLAAAHRDRLGNGAVDDLLGGSPEEHPGRYVVAQPVNGGVASVMINGTADDIVPEQYSTAPGYQATTITIDGADHFDLIDPATDAWPPVVNAFTVHFDS